MKLKAIVFFSLFIGVFVILNLYIGWHGTILLNYYNSDYSQVVYWLVFILISMGYLIGRIRGLGSVGRLIKVIGAYYLAVFEFAVMLLPIADLSALVLEWFSIDAEAYVPILGGIVLFIMALLLLRGSWNAWSPITRTYHLNINKQAGDLKELRIAVVSDIHLGNTVGRRHLKRLIHHLEKLKPDLILLPGDVVDDSIEPFIRNRMSELLKLLKARLGIYAVLGNHEYYGGQIEEYVKLMKAANIQVLRDESVFVEDAFYVVGRKDKTAESMDASGRLSIPTLLEETDLASPVIVMDHQPNHYQAAADAGVDLLLSGHTHRGQLFPNHWITRKLFELDWGYLLKNKMHAIVSSGYGTWGPPIRLASRSEIVEIRVSFADET